MKRVLWIVAIVLIAWAFIIVSRAMGKAQPVQAQSMQQANTEYATPTFRPTETPVPSATIGYEATLLIANATADEARRVNAQVTAQFEQNQLAQLQMTAAQDARAQEVLQWTAIAGPTTIPLTATMQVVINTQIAEGQAIAGGALTATYQAPTQYAAILQISDAARYGWIDQIVRVVMLVGLGVGMFGVGVFALRWTPPQKVEPVDQPSETVVHMRKDTGQGGFNQVRLVVPCSPEQLTELAEFAANGEKKFGINRLETQSRTFRSQRETLLAVRQFLIDAQFVITDANGTITLNADGEQFLMGWFDDHKLPTEYDFAQVQESEPV